MLKVKYSGVNDGKPYPVDRVAFKDGDNVSYLNAENGELKFNGNPVGSGSGKERKVLFSDTLQLTKGAMGMGSASIGAPELPATLFEVGKTYIVTYNGVEYPCVCISQEGIVALGSFEQSNDGVPFTMMNNLDGGSTMSVCDWSGAESCDISIAIETSGGSGGGNVVVFDINTDENDEYIVTCNKSVDEVCQLVASKNAVFYFRAFYGDSNSGAIDTYRISLCPNISESFANGQLLGVVFMINDFEMAHNAVNIELRAMPGGENFTIDVN